MLGTTMKMLPHVSGGVGEGSEAQTSPTRSNHRALQEGASKRTWVIQCETSSKAAWVCGVPRATPPEGGKDLNARSRCLKVMDLRREKERDGKDVLLAAAATRQRRQHNSCCATAAAAALHPNALAASWGRCTRCTDYTALTCRGRWLRQSRSSTRVP